MQCPDCGFRIDELNESQPVCASCGSDPAHAGGDEIDLDLSTWPTEDVALLRDEILPKFRAYLETVHPRTAQ